MKEEVLNMIFSGDSTYSIWKSLQEQLLPDTEENEAQLKNGLYALSKGHSHLMIIFESSRRFVTNWLLLENHSVILTKFSKFHKDLETNAKNFRLLFYQNHHIHHLINLSCFNKILSKSILQRKGNNSIIIKLSFDKKD
ncbi:hypothetical protein Dsin_012329 [Dipteronia sinensis]|uniref:Uncharacterized protein n=1 Tax=Dipteronia sinensis TaxID=43782 RepID=A0AAE0AJ53_9ROSI|nr:hypothetical protein Dsin_012329 [Dipteronia sinensis]